MIANIINTIGSKLLIAFISLSLLLLNSNYLGASGLGSVGLIILGITIILLVSNFVNGGGLIYYASRHSVSDLFFISYSWILITGLVFIPVVLFTKLFAEEHVLDILILGLLHAAISTHKYLLIGKEKIKQANYISMAQSIIQLLCLLYFYFLVEDKSVNAFVNSLYIACFSNLIISFIALVPNFKSKPDQVKVSSFTLFKKLFHYGFYLQLSNIFQLLNYRFSYFLLELYSGRAALGIYSAGVQLSEGMLLPSRSLAMVQHARVSNLDDDKKSIRLSLLLMKVSFFITLPILLILLIIPTDSFVLVLGKDFSAVKPVIAALSIGIIGLSMEGILSHFFSGTGRQKTNSLSSFIGFTITVCFGFYLVPLYGAMGAAYTASIAYLGMLIFMVVNIRKVGGLKLKEFFPQKTDLKRLKEESVNYLKKYR